MGLSIERLLTVKMVAAVSALRDHLAITIGLNYSFVSEMPSIREDSVILDLYPTEREELHHTF